MSYSRTSDAGPDRLALYDRDEDGFPCYGLAADEDTPKCQNCRAASDSLTWLADGWDFLACPKCRAEAEAAAAAERAVRKPAARSAYGVACIGPGLFVRTKARKGGR